MAERAKFSSQEQYIGSVPPDIQPILLRIQSLVQSKVPTATRCISYNMPAYRVGKTFFYFAAFKNLEAVHVSVAALGFPDGATFARVVERAATDGLFLCPLELGPHLRLQFTDNRRVLSGSQPHSIALRSARSRRLRHLWRRTTRRPRAFTYAASRALFG